MQDPCRCQYSVTIHTPLITSITHHQAQRQNNKTTRATTTTNKLTYFHCLINLSIQMSRLASTLVGPLLIATAALALPVCDNVNPKLSCGASYTNEDACSAAGCCWDTNEGVVHPCFAPAISGYLYTELQNTPGVRSGTLSLTQESGIFGGGDFTTLDMTITQETTSRTHIKIVPQGSTQWEIPESLIPRPGGVYDGPDAVTRVQISEPTTPLEIVISRADSSTATEENIFIFSKDMVFQEQYLQYVLGVPSGK